MTVWRKASDCNYGDCVEISASEDLIQIRDSKDPDGPALTFSKEEIRAFFSAVTDGQFDDLIYY